MQARTPEEVHPLFTQFFNAGDLDALVSLYEPDAIIMPAPGQVAKGHSAIRETLAQFRSMASSFELRSQTTLQTGSIALLFSQWKLSGQSPDGNELQMSGQTTDVARQQPDGTWLIAIDSPFGGAGLPDVF